MSLKTYPIILTFFSTWYIVDINECAFGNHSCHSNAHCTNINGSFICACNSGYTGDGSNCQGNGIECFNIFGGQELISIILRHGNAYILFSNKIPPPLRAFTLKTYPTILILIIFSTWYIVDIDECASGNHSCHTNANCTNTDGSFICTCNSGYTGNGTNCLGNWIE